ncbi:MAG TPA: glutamyl-tRNA reductase [Thermodesulfobacteriota bacterium]|nr:glutamyl-tRNA reductase [Thermodesulfobacteriota bacterium]
MDKAFTLSIINLRVTHKKVTIPILEAVRLKGDSISSIAQETIIIQTCNRVEIYVAVNEEQKEKTQRLLIQAWKKRSKKRVLNNIGKDFEDFLEIDYDADAIRHLFRLVAGLESMIVGEDQILGQVRNSLVQVRLSKNIGPVLSLIFDRAIKLGAKVRTETKINKNAVSIGSIAVNLAENVLGDLKNKSSLLIGAGEVGLLVAKSLVSKAQSTMFVTSRSLNRARSLTSVVGGKALKFDDALKKLDSVDFVVLATSAPYHILTKQRIEQVNGKRNGKLLFVLDLSNPRNVEESVADLPNVKLMTIDSIRDEIDHNLAARVNEIKHVEKRIENELVKVFATLRREHVKPVIASFYKHAESIRVRELNRALQLLGDVDFGTLRIINDLSLALVEGILNEPVSNLRRVAENYDMKLAELIEI